MTKPQPQLGLLVTNATTAGMPPEKHGRQVPENHRRQPTQKHAKHVNTAKPSSKMKGLHGKIWSVHGKITCALRFLLKHVAQQVWQQPESAFTTCRHRHRPARGSKVQA